MDEECNEHYMTNLCFFVKYSLKYFEIVRRNKTALVKFNFQLSQKLHFSQSHFSGKGFRNDENDQLLITKKIFVFNMS